MVIEDMEEQRTESSNLVPSWDKTLNFTEDAATRVWIFEYLNVKLQYIFVIFVNTNNVMHNVHKQRS